MPPCQGPCARSTVFALVLLALTTGVQLAPPGIPSAPSSELTAAGASNIAPPVKSGDATTHDGEIGPSSLTGAGGRLCESLPPDGRGGVSPDAEAHLPGVLLWGFRQLLVPEPTAGETVEVQAAEKVVIPPLIDQGLKLEKVVEPKADTATKPVAAKPVQQTSAAATAHVTPSTNSAAANVNAPPAGEAAVKLDEKDDSQKIATAEEKTLAEDEENGAFLDQETKNQQNIEDIVGGEGGVKENMDTGDEDAMYPGEDSDEDPSMDTNVPTAAGGAAVAAGSAPKEMAVREKQPEPLPRLDKEDLSLSDVQRDELPVDPFFEEDDSNFFSYFLLVMFACIVSYVATGRGGFSKGRKHTAAYRKLDSNLEEAIMSNSAASSRSQQQIIY
ncbi:hypothetical protein quinque_009437 [Culex quinquefasciatus]